MPYKHAVINYMLMKVSFLPKELASIYWLEEDVENIKDTWTGKDSYRVVKSLHGTLSKYLSTGDDTAINDINTCPFCIFAENKCNNCGYFVNHGTCLNPHSTYEYVIKALYKGKDKELGIMEYILDKHGNTAIKKMKDTLNIVDLTVAEEILPEPA